MREDHMEAMDKMFPAGYLLVWAAPNGEVRFETWNPNHIEVFEEWKGALIQSASEGPQVYWKKDCLNG